MADSQRTAHWLKMAADAKAVAQSMSDEHSKRGLLDIACGYETLAQYAEWLENLPVNRSGATSPD